MLRIKHSVQHQYNTQVNMMSAEMLSGALAPPEEPVIENSRNHLIGMLVLKLAKKKQCWKEQGYVRARRHTIQVCCGGWERGCTVNPDEIYIDDDDESDEDTEAPITKKSRIEEQAIPI